MHKTLIKIFSATLFITFIIWNRVLRERLNFSLKDIDLTCLKIVILITLIMYFSIIIFLNIKKLLYVQKKSKIIEQIFDRFYVNKLISYVKEYVTESPQYLYEILTQNIRLTITNNTLIYNYIMKFKNPHIIGLGLWHIPQVIIATTFLVDILYYHQLKYFFVSLNLLTIYIITRVIWFILEYHTRRNLDDCYDYLTVTYLPEHENYAINLKSVNQFPINGLSFKEACYQYEHLISKLTLNNHINLRLRNFDGAKNYYNPYFQIYTSLCFLIGWISYLYIILHL